MNNKSQYILTEEKSISKKTKEIADYIINEMLRDCQNIKPKANSNNLVYRENAINIEFTDDIEPITLEYIIYYANKTRSVRDIYMTLFATGLTANCSYDSVDRTLKIICVSDGGFLEKEFYGKVLHEVNHMFQYDKGMKKRVDLYDLVVQTAQDINGTKDEQYAAICLYYTFAHEQDAFTHQFYGELKEMTNDVSFDDAIDNFEIYRNFKRVRTYIKHNSKNDLMQEAFEKLGFDRRTFMQRMQFGWQRFKRKLFNAYQLHMRELNESRFHNSINSQKVFERFTLMDIYGDTIKFIEESEFKKIKLPYEKFANILTETIKKKLNI